MRLARVSCWRIWAHHMIEDRFTVRGAVTDVLPMALLFAGTLMRQSAVGDALRALACAWITMTLVLRIRTGYLRRRPHWTAASWRRYLLVCCIPIGALVILAAMLAALEWRLPIIGAPQSTARSIFAAASIIVMLIGAGGLAIAVSWLATGEPSRQMPWPQRLDRQAR